MNELKQRAPLFEQEHGECPYLEDKQWKTQFFTSEEVDCRTYEALLVEGWRRNSYIFYRNRCESCKACIPIRVDLDAFKPSKSQRRVLRRNQDVEVVFSKTVFQPEDLALFNKYTIEWHQSDKALDLQGYLYFIYSPLPSLMSRYYIGGEQVGVGWMDVLEESVSSVYFAFDPAFAERRLGTFSILREIEWGQRNDKRWMQLGFWVDGCQKMSYKENFRPNEIAVDSRWVPHKAL